MRGGPSCISRETMYDTNASRLYCPAVSALLMRPIDLMAQSCQEGKAPVGGPQYHGIASGYGIPLLDPSRTDNQPIHQESAFHLLSFSWACFLSFFLFSPTSNMPNTADLSVRFAKSSPSAIHRILRDCLINGLLDFFCSA